MLLTGKDRAKHKIDYNTRQECMDSAKFGNKAHFMSFATVIAARNGTEGSNFHICRQKNNNHFT
jgi:hypothetical protein